MALSRLVGVVVGKGRTGGTELLWARSWQVWVRLTARGSLDTSSLQAAVTWHQPTPLLGQLGGVQDLYVDFLLLQPRVKLV